MIIGICDSNDSNFAVEVDKNVNIELVKSLMVEGLDSWYASAHDDIDPTEHFSVDDIEGFYDLGYSEPTQFLLKRYGINYKILDLLTDDDDNYICDELIRN